MARTKVIILSDVHLSNTESYSWFKKQPDAQNIANFFKRTANDPEVMEMVMLGDIFDLWLYPLSVTPWNVQKIISQWSDVINALRECVAKLPSVYYITGNHDMDVSRADIEAISSGGKHVQWITHEQYNTRHPNILHVEHGNDADMFNVPPPYPLGYKITRMLASADQFASFFHIWGYMKNIIDRHHAESKRRVDIFTRAARPEAAVSGLAVDMNSFAPRRLALEARRTTIDLEFEKMNMIDEMLKEAIKHSSVNSSDPFIMPDGKKMSIDEIKKQFDRQIFDMPDQPNLSNGYRANRYWNADNLVESALEDRSNNLSVSRSSLQDYVTNLFNSALAVYDLDWYAKELLQKINAKIVVMGHTHKAAWQKLNGNRWYANSGCWCERNAGNPPTYVTVFMQGNPTVEVVKYYGGNKPDELIHHIPS